MQRRTVAFVLSEVEGRSSTGGARRPRVVELVHAMERGERSPAPEALTELLDSGNG